MINIDKLSQSELVLIHSVTTVDNYDKLLKDLEGRHLIYYNYVKKRYEILNPYLNMAVKKVINIDNGLSSIAEQMMELYPRGNKPYTSASWRGNKLEVAQKLNRLRELTDEDLDYELLLEATRRYIASFNGDYTYMRTLPYFILKRTVENGTFTYKSDLLSTIENIKNPSNENTLPHQDWVGELK